MAYFSNSTEGETYEHNVCSRCIHYKGDTVDEMCPVWEIHLLFNYDQEDDSELKLAMDTLIPRRGIYNDLCSMFHPAKPEWAEHGKNYQEWIAAKEKP